MIRRIRVSITGLVVFALSGLGALRAQSPVDEVDPFIGTGLFSHNFPGALVPWGMVSVSPHTDFKNTSGYYWNETNTLYGFGHVHLSGVGCFDLGNIVLMPTVGPIQTRHERYKSIIRDESASPGVYSCRIERYGVVASMTATERAGISRYVYASAARDANILLDVTQGVSESLGGSVRIVSASEVEGYNTSGRFCSSPTHQRVYFVARFSRPASATSTWREDDVGTASAAEGTSIGAAMTYDVAAGDTIEVRVGISYTSIDNARRNLEEEVGDRSFESVHAAARRRWNDELSRIEIHGGTPDERTVFYTAVYHSLIHPNVFNDVSGEYRRMGDRGIGRVDDYTRYTVYSLWDTYRTVHPLLAIVWPERQNDMTRSLVEMAREFGWLPKWELAGMDAFTMNGDPAAIVIADTWAKGIRDYDLEAAFTAMLRSGTDYVDNLGRPGLEAYLQHGYIPPDHHTGSWFIYGPTSTSQEYYVADASVAATARELCRPVEYAHFANRALGFLGIFDSSTGFFRPRLANGHWVTPFDPLEFTEGDRYFTEGNAWHYRFFAPHDMNRLVALHGGDSAFTARLRAFFDGGQFMWNEHDLAYPYLFTFVDGESWRTQEIVRGLLKDFQANPHGVPSNEDAGALSAWYVLAAIGLYPVVYGSDELQISTPLFDSVVIRPAGRDGPSFTIGTETTPDGARAIAAAELNGRALHRPQLRAREISAGGSLRLRTGPAPSTWGRMLRAPVATATVARADDGQSALSVTWSPHPDAVRYRIVVAEDQTLCRALLDTIIERGMTSADVRLRTSTQLVWWRISSIDGHGAAADGEAQALAIDPLQSTNDRGHSLSIGTVTAEAAQVLFRMPASESGRIVLYDASGREALILPVFPTGGLQTITIDHSGLPSGLYFCRLASASASIALPLILAR